MKLHRKVLLAVVAVGLAAAGLARANAKSVDTAQVLVCQEGVGGFELALRIMTVSTDRRIVSVFPDLENNFEMRSRVKGYCVIHEPANR